MLSDNEKSFLEEGLKNDIPEDELVAKIKESRAKRGIIPAQSGVSSPPLGFNPNPQPPDPADYTFAERAAADAYQGATPKQAVAQSMPYLRLPIAATAAAGSELLAAPAIAASGPFAPATAAAVGTTAYTTADKILGMVDDWANEREIDMGSAGETVEDLRDNMTFGLAIPSAFNVAGRGLKGIGKGGSWLYDLLFGEKPGLSAGRNLEATLPQEGTARAKRADVNREQAREVVEELSPRGEDGIGLTFGQAENDPKMLNFANSAMAKNPGDTAVLRQELRAKNIGRLKEYLKEKLPQGTDIDNVLASVRELYEATEAKTKASDKALGSVAKTVNQLADDDIFAKELRAMLKPAKKNAGDYAKGLWEDLPVIPIDGKETELPLLKLVANEAKAEEDMSLIPMKTIQSILDEARMGTMTLEKVRGWIKRLNRFGNSPDRTKQYFAGRVKDILMPLEKQIENYSPEVSKARQVWGDYAKTFYEGPVGQALKKGKFDGYNVTGSDVIKKFIQTGKPELADSLIKSLGKDKGLEAIKNMTLMDFRKSAVRNGKIDPALAKQWVDKAGKLLKRYDIDISSISDALRLYDEAATSSKSFQDSAFADVLGTNPKEVMKKIFANDNSEEIMREVLGLLKKTKGDKAATEGLKNSFKDLIFTEYITPYGEDYSFNTVYNTMKKFEPTMRLLYKPSELKAMRTFRNALDIVRRGEDASSKDGAKEINSSIISKMLQAAGTKWRVVNAILTRLKRSPDEYNKIVLRAIYDPEFADLLMSASRAEGAKVLGPQLQSTQGINRLLPSAGIGSMNAINDISQGNP